MNTRKNNSALTDEEKRFDRVQKKLLAEIERLRVILQQKKNRTLSMRSADRTLDVRGELWSQLDNSIARLAKIK